MRMPRLQVSGTVSLLRVNAGDSTFGPPDDQIDAEVIAQLKEQPSNAFGCTLRDDDQRPSHQGILDLLRDAFEHDWRVTLDYDIEDGKKNGVIVNVRVT